MQLAESGARRRIRATVKFNPEKTNEEEDGKDLPFNDSFLSLSSAWMRSLLTGGDNDEAASLTSHSLAVTEGRIF